MPYNQTQTLYIKTLVSGENYNSWYIRLLYLAFVVQNTFNLIIRPHNAFLKPKNKKTDTLYVYLFLTNFNILCPVILLP